MIDLFHSLKNGHLQPSRPANARFRGLEDSSSDKSAAAMVLLVEHIDHPSESFRLLEWSESVSVVEIIGPQNTRSRIRGLGELWHVHDDVELTLFESGIGTRVVGDSILPLCVPELVLLGPHVPHCWNCRAASRGLSLQFSIEKGHPLRALPEWEAVAGLLRDSNRGLFFPPATIEKVKTLLLRMIDEDRLARLASFFEVLAALDRQNAKPISNKVFTSLNTTKNFPVIQKVVLEILRRFHEDLALAEMVAITQLSRATFCREFKNYTDRTFVQFLNEVRIDAVRQQLLRTDDSVSDIAFAAGFDNLSHFNRIFRRLTGISPREYRNRIAEDATPSIDNSAVAPSQ
jgi:AraC-like DNA-binding protein